MQNEFYEVTLTKFTYHPSLLGSYFTEPHQFSTAPRISSTANTTNLKDICLIHPTERIKLIPLTPRLVDAVMPMYSLGLNDPLIQPWLNPNLPYDYDSIRSRVQGYAEDEMKIHYMMTYQSSFPQYTSAIYGLDLQTQLKWIYFHMLIYNLVNGKKV